jgi:hypothetical protein
VFQKGFRRENGVVADIRNLPNGRIILPSHRNSHGVAFFNIWSPAGIDIFRDVESNIGRLWRFLLLVGSIIFAFMIVKNNDALSKYFVTKLSQKMTKRGGPNIKMDRVGLETLVGGIAIVFAISVALTVAAMFPGTFTGSIAVGSQLRLLVPLQPQFL